MTSPYYTGSQARRPKFYISESDEGEPSDTSPSATYISFNRPPFTSVLVGPYDEAAGKPESLSTEPAGPVSVPATEEITPSFGGGPGFVGPVGLPYTWVSLRYPDGHTGPTPIELPPSDQRTGPYLSWP